MKYRKPHPNDQDKIEDAFRLMLDFMCDHPKFDGAQWIGACLSILVNKYLESEIPYKEFCQELEEIKEFYKERWDSK